MLPLKEELIGRYGVVRPVLADLHFDDRVAVRAEERAAAFIPTHGRIAHIAVPSTFLGKDRVHALVALLIKGITHPFSCDMRWAHNDAEGLSSAVFFLCCP